MALDRYSKVIFTVIAVALAALAVGQFMPGPVVAQGSGCGETWAPCSVTIHRNSSPLDVRVMN